MINNLSERSFAQRIYVSPSSCASIPFFERDLKRNDNIMGKLENIHGNSQGKLKYTKKIPKSKTYSCSIDYSYAGIPQLC